MKSAKFSHYKQMLDIAIQEAQKGLDEGGIPIGAALFLENGTLLGKGRNGRIQKSDRGTSNMCLIRAYMLCNTPGFYFSNFGVTYCIEQ